MELPDLMGNFISNTTTKVKGKLDMLQNYLMQFVYQWLHEAQIRGNIF